MIEAPQSMSCRRAAEVLGTFRHSIWRWRMGIIGVLAPVSIPDQNGAIARRDTGPGPRVWRAPWRAWSPDARRVPRRTGRRPIHGRLCCLGSGLALSALTEPEALAVHLEDVDVVGQAV